MINTTIAIEFSMHLGEADSHGTIFDKDCILKIFKSRGYLPNEGDGGKISLIPTFFFGDETEFRMLYATKNIAELSIDNTHPLNNEMKDYVGSSKILRVNNNLFLALTIPQELYSKNKEYFANCRVHMVLELTDPVKDTVGGDAYAKDILALNIW